MINVGYGYKHELLGDSGKWFGLWFVIVYCWPCLSQSSKDRSMERPPRTYSTTTRTGWATVLAN